MKEELLHIKKELSKKLKNIKNDYIYMGKVIKIV